MMKGSIIFTIVAISLVFYQTPFAGNEKGYDLNGDWNAVYDSGGYGAYEDVVRITQKENQFVGIYLIKGDNLVGKNEEKIRGKINGNVIDEVFFNDIKRWGDNGSTLGSQSSRDQSRWQRNRDKKVMDRKRSNDNPNFIIKKEVGEKMNYPQ